mmetsp:Transcript_16501/g.34051  ORF Transcript_16501/g.34051 Transcript_16501/m.34051 type:complete len:301 (-) Transcript_16501:70-972(-)
MFPPLNSYLDIADKALTRYVQCLSLGLIEFPLSIIGSWFGIPLTSMALVPLLIVSMMGVVGEDEVIGDWVTAFGCAFLLLCLTTWFYLLSTEKQHLFYGVSKTKLFISILAVQLSCHYNSARSSAVASRYLCSYFMTQLWVLWLKFVCRRMRPAHAMTEELKSHKRRLPKMTFLGTKGYTVFESFPSGDAAGGMVASLALIDAIPGVGYWGYALAVGASFGRMYFFAHHVLDVSVGCGIACVCTEALKTVGRAHDFEYGIWHAVAGMVLFILGYKQLCKMRRPLPRQFISRGGGWIDNDP